jgi:hypothetical protein
MGLSAIMNTVWDTIARYFPLSPGSEQQTPQIFRAFLLVPAEPRISERILCPLSRISSNLHVRTLRIFEPHFALPRQQLIPIAF